MHKKLTITLTTDIIGSLPDEAITDIRIAVEMFVKMLDAFGASEASIEVKVLESAT